MEITPHVKSKAKQLMYEIRAKKRKQAVQKAQKPTEVQKISEAQAIIDRIISRQLQTTK